MIIILLHSNIWLHKSLLHPIGCKNVLIDEFHSSNHENNIKSRQALTNRTFKTIKTKYDIIFHFLSYNRVKKSIEHRYVRSKRQISSYFYK